MKRFLIVLLAAGGLLFASAGDASAHWRGYGYRSFGPRPYSAGFARYGYGGYPGRSGLSISIGSGYYGSRISGGYYGGGYAPVYGYGGYAPVYGYGGYGGYCH